jgi:hypothetical protein
MIAADTFKCSPDVQLLPSAGSALSFARGEPGSGWAVLTHLAARALVVTPAVIAVGHAQGVPVRKAIALGVAAAVAIEVAVIYLAFRQVRRADKEPDPPMVAEAIQGVEE